MLKYRRGAGKEGSSAPICLSAFRSVQSVFFSPGYPVSSGSFIDLTFVPDDYLYILSLNQNKMGAGLTSNVQTYDAQNLALNISEEAWKEDELGNVDRIHHHCVKSDDPIS